MKITLLGQAGFFVELNSGLTVMIDPYLSDSLYNSRGGSFRRLVPICEEWQNVMPDVLVFTHEHADHYDPESVRRILGTGNRRAVLCTYPVFEIAKPSFPGNNYVIMRPSVEFSFADLHIRAVKAFHENPQSVGYVLSAEGKNVYFSGDTLLSDEIIESIGRIKIDLAFVCINGFGNNMNAQDAALLAQRLKPDVVVPVHWDMFKMYGADPFEFKNFVKDKVCVKIIKSYEEICL